MNMTYTQIIFTFQLYFTNNDYFDVDRKHFIVNNYLN